MEERDLTKGNIHSSDGAQTQSWKNTTLGLMNVRAAALKDKNMQFTSLMHHIDIRLLRESFYILNRYVSFQLIKVDY